ncbi:MAG: cation:proton antiporter [Fimbriimonas sp.]
MTADSLTLMLGLIGVVVLVASLLSGFIERTNFPQVAVFLALGALVGPHGLGVLDVGIDSPILRMVATLSLTLVLFTDALTIDLQDVRRHASLAAIILGPGTVIAAALIALAATGVLGLPLALAAILAAPLASTDPVLLRGLLRRPSLPTAARQALRLESGLNDVVLLPIVLVAMTFATDGGEKTGAGKLLLQMLVLGPGAGALVAWLAIMLLQTIRARVGVRRDYESLYSLGVALAAFAAAESLHGSGFLAAFAAGLTIAALDVELCDCFREYGETTAEMLLLFTFVLLGTSLMWMGLRNVSLTLALFVVLALAARPLALALALWRTQTDSEAKRAIVWYGPRGLSSLLLILVPVFALMPGTESLFHIASVVVLVSIVVNGGSMISWSAAGHSGKQVQATIMTVEELQKLISSGEPVWLLDVRTEKSFLASEQMIKGSVRIDPQHARRDAIQQGVPKDAWAALFCT